MTCREKLAMEYPNAICPEAMGGCMGCPDDGPVYLPKPNFCRIVQQKYDLSDAECEDQCTRCWNREIPGTEPTNTEKESKTMEKKTKAQLIEEIRAMQKELANLEKYKKYEETANEMYAIYESFMNAGFTKEQAWELLITSMKTAQNTSR